MMAQGSRVEDLRAALGPAIAGQVYELELELALGIVRSAVRLPADPQAALALGLSLPDSPLFERSTPGKVGLHVRQVSAMQLEGLGLLPHQIAVSPHSTFEDAKHFFSHRRDPKRGVQWSGILS
jgi:polyphenol oxidase